MLSLKVFSKVSANPEDNCDIVLQNKWYVNYRNGFIIALFLWQFDWYQWPDATKELIFHIDVHVIYDKVWTTYIHA